MFNEIVIARQPFQEKPKQSPRLLRRLRLLAMTMPAVLFIFLTLSLFTGCNKASYPEGKVEKAIQEICSKEYKIEGVEVKFVGKTVSVFLPLKKLFTTDVREEILSGRISNLESLFEPEPQALEQLENVLFTISRVLLSSDKPVDFYILEATDVESTGLQLILTGFVDDVKRVRLWDISRTEYRKRVLHELKFNRAVLWEKPVRDLFREATNLNLEELGKRYFTAPIASDNASPLLYQFLVSLKDKQNVQIEFDTARSQASRSSSQAWVYVKFKETYETKPGISGTEFAYPSGTTLEYIFVVEPSDQHFKIVQAIPFYYSNESGQLVKINLPAEFNLGQNLESWPERFTVEELSLGEFLARQLNRRIQGLLLADERIHHTIRHAQVNFTYRDGSAQSGTVDGEPHFSLYFDFLTKGMQGMSRTIQDMVSNEDVLYLFNMILKEFADVARSYRFKDFRYLELVWEPGTSSTSIKLDPNRLDLFRLKKITVADLLESPIGRPNF